MKFSKQGNEGKIEGEILVTYLKTFFLLVYSATLFSEYICSYGRQTFETHVIKILKSNRFMDY